MKKSIALLVSCVLLVLTLATSCADKNSGTWLLNLEGEEQQVSCALTVGDEEISYDFFRYLYLNFKAQMEEDDSEIDWSNEENKENLLNRTIEQIKHIKSVEALAEKHGFELTEDEKDSIDSTMESVFDTVGGADAFKEILSNNFLTYEVYERVLTANTLYTAMCERLIGTDQEQNKIVVSFDQALESFSESYIRLALVGFDVDPYDSEGNEVDEETFETRKEKVKAEADAAYEKLKNGDFLTLMKDYYEEDEEINLQYYFPIDNLNTLFDTDFSKMEIGAVTEPMFSDITYFILYRMENDKEYLEENESEQVITYYAEEKIGEEITGISDSLKVTTTEDYKLVSPDTII